MPITTAERFKSAAYQSRESYINDLTDVAWLALKDAGLAIEHDGHEYDQLRDAVRSAVK